MATVQRESIGNLHDKLVVTISKEDYLPTFEKSLKSYSKSANVPGFRKGHVPTGMVKKMYGQSLFIDEVLKAANKQLESYLQEHKPLIFGQPLPIQNDDLKVDMNDAKDFSFHFEIGLKPEVKMDLAAKKGTINRYVIQVDDDMVNQEVEHLRHRSGEMENPESLEKDSDIAYLQFEASNEAGEVKEGTEPVLAVEALKDFAPAMADLVKDKKSGESFIMQPSQLFKEEELTAFMKKTLQMEDASQDAKDSFYKVTLTKVGRIIPKELNAAFFQEIFPNSGIEEEEAFKTHLKEELKKEVNRYAIDRMQNEIFESLVHGTPMDLPVTFLKSWLRKSGETEKTEEEVEKEYPSFDHQLRWTLISDQLIKEFKIEVTLEEVMADIKGKMMSYFGLKEGDDAPWMDSYLEKMSKDEKAMDETYRRILFDKLFAKIAEAMDVQEKEVTQEEFNQLPQGHHHH